MKKILKVIRIGMALAILSFSLQGCFSHALYGSEEQYESGDHYWLAGAREMARTKQDKLALEKLEALPAHTAVIDLSGELTEEKNGTIFGHKTVPAGYKGIIFNKSRYRAYNFVVSGPETTSWYLEPGDTKEAYLLPGTYLYKRYYGSQMQDKPLIFNVSAQTHQFGSQKVHWYIGAEW
ncbi:MAG: hypothetical protein U9R06_00485 [Patescibacteria group bacterium]|nr:hypothetical protein [Patescibacteria group bacterium]